MDQTVTRAALSERAADATGLSRHDTAQIGDRMFELIGEALKAGEGQQERPSRAAATQGTAGQPVPASGVASVQQKKRPPEKRDEIYEELFGAPAPAAPGAPPAAERPAPERKPSAPTRPFD